MSTPSSWTNISFIKASTPVLNSGLGNSCAVYGNVAVFGAPAENSNIGAVYIYSKDISTGIWSQQQKITGTTGSYFGKSVSLYNDTLVIGANNNGFAANPAYISIYTLVGSTWTLQQTIASSTVPGSDNFGISVSVYNNTLIVGAQTSERAYIYVRSGTVWNLQETLSPVGTSRFGCAVTIYGDTAVVGEQFESTTAINSGAAYIYTRSGVTWTLQQKIKATLPIVSIGFGNSLALYGDILVVGIVAPSERKAYVFTRSGVTWTQRQILVPSYPGASGFSFGLSVSIYDNIIVVGSSTDNGNATGVNGTNTGTLSSAGSAFAFITSDSGATWAQNAYLKAAATPPPVANDNLGTAVAIYGTIILSGAPGQDTGTSSSGAGYIYEPPFIAPSVVRTAIVEDPCCTFVNCIRPSLPTILDDSIIAETQEAKTILSATNTLYNGINNGTITANPNPTFGSYREYMLYVQGKLKYVKG